MFRIGRSVEALFRKPPELPSIEGDAFVFGSAPNPVVPEKLLSRATVVTANASQLYLERFGFEKPDITFMRSTMHWGESTDHLKQEQLRGRSTGLLVLPSKKTDPNCTGQLEMLDRIGYRFDDLKIVDRADCYWINNRVLNPKSRYLMEHFAPSMGLRATIFCRFMGARNVYISGISLRRDGYSFSNIDHKRLHVDDDLKVFRRINSLELPVWATDQELAEDSDLECWQP